MRQCTLWPQLAALVLALGHAFAQEADTLKNKIGWTEEELLRDLTPIPTGVPQNDPWALPLIDGCPRNCVEAGPDSANWTQLYDQNHLNLCKYPLLFAFNVHNSPSRYSTIRVCALNGGDGKRSISAVVLPEKDGDAAPPATGLPTASFSECGAGESTTKATVKAGFDVLSENTRSDAMSAANFLISHLSSNTACGNIILFAKFGVALVGLYAGADLKKDRAAELLHKYCTAKTSTTIGFFASEGNDIGRVQEALRTWALGECLPSQGMRVVEKSVELGILLSTAQRNASNSTQVEGERSRRSLASLLTARGECRAIQVDDGDSCASLASKCGISGAQFTKYNSDSKLHTCSTLMKGRWVCCSSGNLPDKRPKTQADGTCYTLKVDSGDSCWGITTSYGITTDELNKWNKETWGWQGCAGLQKDQIICLSSGNSPMPATVDGVACGPQKPGTRKPSGSFTGKDLAKLNPCPLNACCSGWGYCGTTAEFCTESLADTGAPGTHKPGTNGCISNCNMNIIRSPEPPASFLSIGYFEGYGLTKMCDRVDIRTIDLKKYTHIHFAFATVTANTFDVNMGPTLNQFYYFKQLTGVKKILAFGGWTFSTDPATYGIFRTGVSPAHRLQMAQSIAKFIIDNELDGVDIDWEYPAAPDLPDIPAGDPAEGINYLKFLITLKQLLPADKTLSFAAPASFWYLKGFPIAQIMKVVDYVVYMTYDLHGQWDYGNKWSTPGCPAGNCLRSHVNMTETLNALSMITKAGAPSNKIAVGVTSYGRSFKMATPGCTGPMCTYTGPKSQAAKGRCTDTAGYISQNEIDYIIKNNPSATKLYDDASLSDILIYDETEWVAYMSADNKKKRRHLYRALNFLGTSDWAISLDGTDLVKPEPSTMSPVGPSLARPGVMDLLIHDSCKIKGRLEKVQEAWFEAGDISKAPYEWSRWNRYQKAMDNYFGKRSGQVPIIGTDKLWGTWFWSEYYILLCPGFLDELPNQPKFTSLKDLAYEADSFPLLQQQINRWSSGVRAVTMYHEVAHFQDVSDPECGKIEFYNPREIVVKARSGSRIEYEELLRNAHSWALAAVSMWMMKRWPNIDVPLPRNMKPQSEGNDDDNDGAFADDVDPDTSFDASRVDPSKFTWLSRLTSTDRELGLHVLWQSR
ncbi:hypothetical protein MHUMG1_00012 [Metarhizium humberi]|uniref:chitinase n=1 Tax=Metarhizium humberi TaxID=2596975 RepID=A0A9P8MI51_9HYPO|nr:hypothetical protein MHUMG1_00012 [Metarhizium humberi]